MLNNKPVVLFAIIFSFGIIAAKIFRINFWQVYWALAVLLMLLPVWAENTRGFNVVLFCAVLLLGMIRLKNSQTVTNCDIGNFTGYGSKTAYIKGFVAGDVLKGDGGSSFIFNASRIQFDNLANNCCGFVLVHSGAAGNLHYGDELILYGNLYRPYEKNYRKHLYNKGIRAILKVKLSGQIVNLNRNRGLKIKRLAFWLKNNFENKIYKYLHSTQAAILDAMVLGEKKGIPQSISDSMIKSGTIHILVVSGFNAGLVAFIAGLFLKVLRLNRRFRFCAVCLILIIYCLMTGGSTPVVRATIMAIIFILAYFFKRLPDIYNSCAVAALVILTINPGQLFDIGFQLSFVSVISIIYFFPRIKSLLHFNSAGNKYLRFLIDSIAVSFSAWLGTAGFIVYYFKIISPVTVLANLFIVPLASLITLCGFCLLATSFILPSIAVSFAGATELMIYALLGVNKFLIAIPGAYFYFS